MSDKNQDNSGREVADSAAARMVETAEALRALGIEPGSFVPIRAIAETAMHNVEYKSEVRDMELARTICRGLRAVWIAELRQTDTYYRIPSGRLKKRECVGEPVEYIFYDRPDLLGSKISHYTLYTEPQARARFGTEPLPVWLTVRKVRTLYLIGNVRIHLDEVEGLGRFMELEAVVCPDFNLVKCRVAVSRLVAALRPALGEPIDCSYSDMLAREIACEGVTG